MSTALVPVPDTEPIKAESTSIIVAARTLAVIREGGQYATALEMIGDMRRFEKRVTEAFEPTRNSLDQAKKDLLKLRDSIVEPIERERVALGHRCEPWEMEQKRLAEVERQKKEEELRREAEQRQLEEAILAEEAGDTEAAEQIEAAPVAVPFVASEPMLPKVAGVSARESWHAEVRDFVALIRFVAEDADHRRHLLLPNDGQLNSQARMYKVELAIPGVEAVCETVRSVRG
jgi:hypothetical protein